jgi:nuclear transcription factor Y gamma
MIAGETPILFSKACELFIIELAYRSWVHTLDSNRRTLQVNLFSNLYFVFF